jgi:hypothetical protein
MPNKGVRILAALEWLVIALFLPMSSAIAAGLNRHLDEETDPEFISFSTDRWFTMGRDKYKVSQQVPNAILSGFGLNIGQTYEFNRADASMNLYKVEVHPHKRFFIDAQYAAANTRAGDAVEHDWVSAQNVYFFTPNGALYTSPDHVDFGNANLQQTGQTQWITTSIYGRVLSTKGDPWTELHYNQDLDVLAGYDRYVENFVMTNWYQTLTTSNILNEPPVGYLAGYSSSYNMEWQGARFGVRESITTNYGVKIRALVAYSPLQKFNAVGFDSNSAQAGILAGNFPNYHQHADASIFDGYIEASYSPIKYFSLEAGFSWLYFWTRNGVETDFYANGTNADRYLETATSQRDGFYAGATLKF